jgi:hypothetical protein
MEVVEVNYEGKKLLVNVKEITFDTYLNILEKSSVVEMLGEVPKAIMKTSLYRKLLINESIKSPDVPPDLFVKLSIADGLKLEQAVNKVNNFETDSSFRADAKETSIRD